MTEINVAVIIPAAACPCEQVTRVRPQLGVNDRLVVVWNGDRPKHDCERFVRSMPSCEWVSTAPRLGPGRARNVGVASLEKRARVLLFCDADDQVAPDWIATLAGPLLGGRADLVGGALHVVRGDAAHLVVPDEAYSHRQAIFAGNCGVTFESWQTLGGFDSELRCCEDTDLAWGAAEAGLRVEVVPAAVVTYVLKSIPSEFVQRFRWGFWAPRLLRKHRVGYNHLPGLFAIFQYTAALNFASCAATAALGLWLGSWCGRFQRGRSFKFDRPAEGSRSDA